jgi:catechol 2,3-dioxygenase-like lactoylglutathione lyase family enzyme
MGISLQRVDVIVLFVADVDRARTFYRDTFGLEPQTEDEVSAFYKLDTISIAILGPAAAHDLLSADAVSVDPSAGTSSQLVAFVSDVDATYADLVARGVEFVREPTDRAWGLRTAHFKDPDGHIWEIAQPIATVGKISEMAQSLVGE